MKSIGKWIIVLIAVLTLAGCIESNTVIEDCRENPYVCIGDESAKYFDKRLDI